MSLADPAADAVVARAVAQITAFDPGVFTIKSQTKPADKVSLLRIQSLVRQRTPGYTYMELGSHLGGSLTPHLLDPHCRAVLSLDPRPQWQPDQRARRFDYDANSTQRMLDLLAAEVPPAQMAKLRTFDLDASDLRPNQVEAPVDLAFIDAEHTVQASFRDFLAVRRFAAPDAVVIFHDANLIFDAIANVEALLDHQGVRHAGAFLPETVFVLLLGASTELLPQLEPHAVPRAQFLNAARAALWDTIAESRRLQLPA